MRSTCGLWKNLNVNVFTHVGVFTLFSRPADGHVSFFNHLVSVDTNSKMFSSETTFINHRNTSLLFRISCTIWPWPVKKKTWPQYYKYQHRLQLQLHIYPKPEGLTKFLISKVFITMRSIYEQTLVIIRWRSYWPFSYFFAIVDAINFKSIFLWIYWTDRKQTWHGCSAGNFAQYEKNKVAISKNRTNLDKH